MRKKLKIEKEKGEKSKQSAELNAHPDAHLATESVVRLKTWSADGFS